MIRVCLYDCVNCNNGSLMFKLLMSLLIVYCNVYICHGYLCNTLLISLLSMLQRIDLNAWRQLKTAVYSKVKERASCNAQYSRPLGNGDTPPPEQNAPGNWVLLRKKATSLALDSGLLPKQTSLS